jgi:hypothetical protein
VGTFLAARFEHAGPGGYLSAVVLGLLLAVANFWSVHKTGYLLARLTNSSSKALQDWMGKGFCFVFLLWAVCTEIIGFHAASVVLRLITLKLSQ